MTRRFLIICLLFLAIAPQVRGQTVLTLRSWSDLAQTIRHQNIDIQLLQQNVKQSQATLSHLKVDLMHPSLSASGSFNDTQEEPLSTFYPARTTDYLWQTTITQPTPLGVDFSTGVSNEWTKLFQSNPPNALLPYPASYNQPALNFSVQADLMRDFLGFTSRRNLSMAKDDVQIAKLQQTVSSQKLLATAGALFTELPLLDQMIFLKSQVVQELQVLKDDTQKKVNRSLADGGDVYRLDSLVANMQGDVTQIRRGRDTVKTTLQNMLGDSDRSISVEPDVNMDAILSGVDQCASQILQNNFDSSRSSEFALYDAQKHKGTLLSEVTRYSSLPDVNLSSSFSTTGNDAQVSPSIDEVTSLDHPVYSVELSLSVPLTVGQARANKKLADVAKLVPKLEADKLKVERQNQWADAQQKIQLFNQERNQISQSIGSGDLYYKDLQKRYLQGRVSFYELTQQKIDLLNLKLRRLALDRERMNHVYQTLQNFDRLSCSLLPAEVSAE